MLNIDGSVTDIMHEINSDILKYPSNALEAKHENLLNRIPLSGLITTKKSTFKAVTTVKRHLSNQHSNSESS